MSISLRGTRDGGGSENLPTPTALLVTAKTRKNRRPKGRRQPSAYLYIAPAFLVFVLFLGVQLSQTIQYSFFNWNGLGAATFAGFNNFVTVFQDEGLRQSFLHAGVLMIFYAGLPVAGALLLTALISRAHRMRSMSFYRTVLFLPQVISSVVVGTIWVSIYSQNGLANQLLRAVGLGDLTQVWLGEYSTALIAIGLVGTWLNIGLCLVLFLSGVGNIPPELFEAARIDGAGRAREFPPSRCPRFADRSPWRSPSRWYRP